MTSDDTAPRSDASGPAPSSSSSTGARATVIVTQRERFGMTAESLSSLLENTDEPFELVYVDANSPRRHAQHLVRESRRRGFTLIRHERYLTPNQARNIGLAAATTPYVVFVDNDVLYTPGWLTAAVDCAEETGAAIVAPLICQALPAHETVHHAGGDYTAPGGVDAFFDPPPPGGRPFVEVMHGHGEPLADLDATLRRGETGFCEFHVVLARRDLFEVIGPLDEAMLSTKEHIDFSLSTRAAGGRVWFEPSSVVTYVFPNRDRPLEVSDWPFFALRWSDAHGRRSLEHFVSKWELDPPEGYVEEKKRIYGYRRVQAILVPIVSRVPLLSRSRKYTTKAAFVLGHVEKPLNRLLVAYHDARAA
ncbi:glycosyltransferase family 2 protein [Ilumatobacter sp.]|uniref:glycosyltransferase family 2 protein n=1 Tax=Ilumatobacter sp. TaxID=1967498 RepID=UPI003B52847C